MVIQEGELMRFVLALRTEDRSGGTIDQYFRDVRAFAAWLGERELTPENAAGWREYLLERGRAPVTINSMLSAVNRFFRFAQALHGQNVFALQLLGPWDTGFDRLAVDEDGTGSAGPFAASVLDRGQTKPVPQNADQLQPGRGFNFFSIDKKNRHTRSPVHRRPQGAIVIK